MCNDSNTVCLCNLRGTIDTISKKWAICTISTIGNHGTMRYNELMDDLCGISPKSLADLLKILEKEGLIRRESFNEIPPRVEYSLTEDGQKLREALVPLLEWAAARDAAKNKPHVPRSAKRGQRLRENELSGERAVL